MGKKANHLILIIALLTFLYGVSIGFVGFGSPTNAPWFNVSWHYRLRLEVNATDYIITNWPVEEQINFSDLLKSGTFDINSTRVFEYSQSGVLLQEVPSQFDIDENYNASNAFGTLVFLMNGTTQANNTRIFYF